MNDRTLRPTAKPPVCRFVPTGSRIATQRRRSGKWPREASDAERDRAQRDIAERRMRQTMREQARAQGRAEALQRRGGQ